MRTLALAIFISILTISSAHSGPTKRYSGEGVTLESIAGSNAYVIVPADYEIFPVEIWAESKSGVIQLEGLVKGRKLLLDKIKDLEGFERAVTGAAPADSIIEVDKKGVYQSVSRSLKAITVNLHFKTNKDSLDRSLEITKALMSLPANKDQTYRYHINSSFKTLDNAEQYREAVLMKLEEQLTRLEAIPLKYLRATISGLQNPLEVKSYGEDKFLVYLPYNGSVVIERGEPAETEE